MWPIGQGAELLKAGGRISEGSSLGEEERATGKRRTRTGSVAEPSSQSWSCRGEVEDPASVV